MRPISRVLPLLALVLLPSLPTDVSACSCTNEPDFTRAFAESDAIFLGEVLEIRSAEPQFPDHVWALINVEAKWKGGPLVIARVLTPENGAICGYTFEVGTRHLVYAFEGGGELGTHLCWRTHAYYPEDPDLASLGPTPIASGSWGSIKTLYR